ncbi:MAG: hypothetical protein K0B16_13870, partial [Burkholderiaceae bacterium]|nr:hypothetical protein [Burkholderiaceae bacterium]
MSQATTSTKEERLTGSEAAIARRQARSLYGKKGLTGGGTAASAGQARLATRNGQASPAPAAAPASTPAPGAASPEARTCGCQHGDAAETRVEYARPALALEPISAAQQRRID